MPDGYLNCWYLGREPEKRWTNLRDNHELYNAGHMLEGAIAYFETTGRRRWLDIMERYVEHIRQTFGTGPGQKRGYCGHQEIELALIKLYHLTGEKKHLDLAAYFINERGQQPPHYFDVEREEREQKGWETQRYVQGNYEYSQSHKPVREQDKVVGHAVRAMYMYTAMADLAVELNDAALKQACEMLWDDVMDTKMYVTAGLGPSAHNEGFTDDYDLPNQTAYAETCASVALIFWAQRMLHLDLDGKYADVLELALFNGALSGLSRDGEHYFYVNPLESDGTPTRWEWHTCPCCTMNVSRLVASVGGYFVSTGARRHRLPPLWRHLDDARRRPAPGWRCARPRTIPGRATISDRDRSRDAGDLRRQAPHPRLVPAARRCRSTARPVDGEPESTATSPSTAPGPRATRSTLDLPMPAERSTRIPASSWMSAAWPSSAGRWSTASRKPTIRAAPVQRLKLPRERNCAVTAARPTCSTASSRCSADGHGHRRGRLVDALPHHARPARRRRRSPPCPTTSGPTAARARWWSGSRRPNDSPPPREAPMSPGDRMLPAAYRCEATTTRANSARSRPGPLSPNTNAASVLTLLRGSG